MLTAICYASLTTPRNGVHLEKLVEKILTFHVTRMLITVFTIAPTVPDPIQMYPRSHSLLLSPRYCNMLALTAPGHSCDNRASSDCRHVRIVRDAFSPKRIHIDRKQYDACLCVENTILTFSCTLLGVKLWKIPWFGSC
jgi:hypothetical protein